MSKQATVDAAVLDQFVRDFEAEGELIKRRLGELGAKLKLINVAIVGTEDDGDEDPIFITIMIEPVPHADAMKPYLTIAEGKHGRHH